MKRASIVSSILCIVLCQILMVQAKSHHKHSPSQPPPSSQSGSGSFDFFYFVVQWPGAYCDSNTACCYPLAGKPDADFSIHGLWPNYDDGTYPQNCEAHESFDVSKIRDIRTELDKYWGSLACPSSNSLKFWSHEWSKHGTCSQGFDEAGYFSAALNLKKSLDLLAGLDSAGIRPDDGMYSLDAITTALQQTVGHIPAVQCNRDPDRTAQLYQIYICVATDGSTLIDCPIFPRNNCPSQIQFPAFGTDISTKEKDTTSNDEL